MARSARWPQGRVLVWVSVAAAVAGVTAVVFAIQNGAQGPARTVAASPAVHAAASVTAAPAKTDTDSGGGLDVSFATTSMWGNGYVGQYTLTNAGGSPLTGWTLAFQLPSGTKITSLWNGVNEAETGRVTVRNASWDGTVKPGQSVTVGFETSAAGQAGPPSGCTIDGAVCTGATGTPIPTPASTVPVGKPSTETAGFAPYVDATLYPIYNLVAAARQTGVKQFNLAFIVAAASGGCTPEWGALTPVGADPVAAQIGDLRAIGGDVRISFGGEENNELAVTCTSVSRLEAAYQAVISAYRVDKVDFDIEGTALADTAASQRRDRALVALQRRDKDLRISFTLPVLPSGLTAEDTALLAGAVRAGVRISAVDVMTMDYGDGAAPHPSGMMGTYAIDAATAADAQIASVLGISDDAAWLRIAITPMIGVNDIPDEIFTVANARQLERFAAIKHIAWLSMWSAARDTECPGGAQPATQNTCSSIVAPSYAFADVFGAY